MNADLRLPPQALAKAGYDYSRKSRTPPILQHFLTTSICWMQAYHRHLLDSLLRAAAAAAAAQRERQAGNGCDASHGDAAKAAAALRIGLRGGTLRAPLRAPRHLRRRLWRLGGRGGCSARQQAEVMVGCD
jgi:hypothetical protein